MLILGVKVLRLCSLLVPQRTWLSLRFQVDRYMGRGIEQLGRSFGSNLLPVVSYEVAGSHAYSH